MRLGTGFCWLVAVLLAAAVEGRADEKPLSRIAFGSCANQDRPQPVWEAIVATRPEMFLFLGDNVYADTEDMDMLRATYQRLGQQPGFQKLKQTRPVLATWDDHDFGANDVGGEYPKKRQSQEVFLDFFEVAKDDPRRRQEGVYQARVFGPVGKRVQIILLDTRYFRSPLKKGFKGGERGEGRGGVYLPDTDPQAAVLGEPQWKWLAEQFKTPAEVRLIGSSIQFVADEHGSEKWGNFPKERERLLDLLRQSQAAGVIFLSGDRHLAEISRLPVSDKRGPGYPLYDITSSSLNVPSGHLTKAGSRFANEVNSYRVGLTYFEANFGTIAIDWSKPDPVIRLQVRDTEGDVVLQQRMALSELRPANK
jgi:alkaline phosphatase D